MTEVTPNPLENTRFSDFAILLFYDHPVYLRTFLRAGDGTRTRDLLTTNEVRYRLCHASLYGSSTSRMLY